MQYIYCSNANIPIMLVGYSYDIWKSQINHNMRFKLTNPLPHNIAASPDIIDIALVNEPRREYSMTNYCDLFSNHNPITMLINDSLINAHPLTIMKRINWSKLKPNLLIKLNYPRIL